MAKLTELKDRVTGEIILPKTVASNVYTPKGTKLTEELDKKANIEDLSNVLAEEVASDEVIEVINPTTIDEIKEEIAGGKLDKSVWDERNKQFRLIGYYTFEGGFLPTQGYYNSGPIPLNNNEDLHLNTGKGGNFVSLIFFDINKKFVSSAFNYILNSDLTIEKSEYPQNAVYFIASTTQPDNTSYSNGVTFELREVAVSNVIEKSKYALFIDEWNARCIKASTNNINAINRNTFGRYNKETGFFELNGLTDITYEQAIEIMRVPDVVAGIENNTTLSYSRARTLFPIVIGNTATLQCACSMMPNLEVVRIVDYYILNNNADPDTHPMTVYNTRDVFYQGGELREVKGILKLSKNDALGVHFYSSLPTPKLETIWLQNVCLNMNLQNCKSIKYECWAYMIENANNTSPITITVHPDVYAKLSNTSNTEWNKVLTDAAAKNITFITNG